MNFKRSIAVVLTFILCLSTLTGLGKNASAAGEEDQALLIGFRAREMQILKIGYTENSIS